MVAGHPFDTIKVLLQSEARGQERGSIATARHLLHTTGARGLYRGLAAPLLGGSLETAVNYTVYHRVRGALVDAETSGGGGTGTPAPRLGLPASALLAGGVAGVALSAVLSPLELLKCRVQAGVDESVRAAARRVRHPCLRRCAQADDPPSQVWAQAGLRGFARGLGGTLAREVPGNALFFASYEALQRSATSAGLGESSLAAPLCGGMAGVAYWLVVLPLDTAKTRIQVLSPGQPCAELGLLGTLREEYRQRGFARGWYAGARPVILRAFVANAAQWAAFEWAVGAF